MCCNRDVLFLAADEGFGEDTLVSAGLGLVAESRILIWFRSPNLKPRNRHDPDSTPSSY
jgi:hypothetical protein